MGHGANRTGAGIFDDIDRFFDHMVEPGAAAEASPRFGEIIEAVDIDSHSPLIGQKIEGGKRELSIGRSSRGFVALYRFLPDIDTVFVVAILSQRGRGSSATDSKISLPFGQAAPDVDRGRPWRASRPCVVEILDGEAG